MPRKPVRVEIPRDPSEAIALLGTVKAKSDALGAASPLAGLEWDKIAPAHARAAEHDGKADQFRKDSERETGERNKDMPAVNDALRSARDVLLGVYRSNPKKLGDFGFEVADSPAGGGDDAAPGAPGGGAK